ncbi:hypothetical protein [Streptomyces sp. HSG2]|uniref:hypothetical protein n=1 Tax=Streptomyces sp. HSG2 TaxID=2797167 RepID=UPI001908CDCB|nr:hypothetical protein [Streptomyces sp. HSG2]
MQSQEAGSRHKRRAAPAIAVERAEAALVEHYPRLVRLAYLVLPPAMGRRRAVAAHALTQGSLPRRPTRPPAAPTRPGDPAYALLRARVVRAALRADPRPLPRGLPRLSRLPPLLPQVRGLLLGPRALGPHEDALEKDLSALSPAGRAAFALRGLEGLSGREVREALRASGVADTAAASREADALAGREPLLSSPGFDACTLRARPTPLSRRRRHGQATLAAVGALVACAALVGGPSTDWGPEGAAAPPYARNPAAEEALDPSLLTRARPTAWRTADRTDFAVWPARGDLVDDEGLLRRALAVWARPGRTVRVSATPGTPTGGPAGPPRLLYAGTLDAARVVILHDGLRLVRYAEPAEGEGGAALDLARTDAADRASAAAVVLGRTDGNTRYLTAPWVTGAAEVDLARPGDEARELSLTDGVTSPAAGATPTEGACASWRVLELTDGEDRRLMSDLGEVVPAHLTAGPPGTAGEVVGATARRAWAPFACSLGSARGLGVRSVNAWAFAEQPLPEESGTGAWVCTRATTWRGEAARTLVQFHSPDRPSGAVVAAAEGVPACGARDPGVLAGVLWTAPGGERYLLAAGDPDTTSLRATGGVEASADGHVLTAPADDVARVRLSGTSRDGRKITPLGGDGG